MRPSEQPSVRPISGEVQIPADIVTPEGTAWHEIWTAYQDGMIETIQEAEEKFQLWTTVQALGAAGLKHVW